MKLVVVSLGEHDAKCASEWLIPIPLSHVDNQLSLMGSICDAVNSPLGRATNLDALYDTLWDLSWIGCGGEFTFMFYGHCTISVSPDVFESVIDAFIAASHEWSRGNVPPSELDTTFCRQMKLIFVVSAAPSGLLTSQLINKLKNATTDISYVSL